MKPLYVADLGLVPYADAWALQKRLAERRAAGALPDTLLVLEHPHIFTLGRSGHSEHVLWDEAERARRGVDVQWVDRGGDVTYHGPGQLVGYPIMRVGRPDEAGADAHRAATRDLVGYVRAIEQALIEAAAALGVTAGRRPGYTGVWVGTSRERPGEKLVAIGVRLDARGVSSHGFALNVNPDLDYFGGIVPCGITAGGVTSLTRVCGAAPDPATVRRAVVAAFAHVFEAEPLAVTRAQLEAADSLAV